MSRCHGKILSGSQQLNRGPTNMAEKNKTKKNWHVLLSWHDCTEEQNGSPYFSSIVRECKWPSLSRTRNFANMVT